MTSQFGKIILASLSLFFIAVAFQNCGQAGFQAGDVKVVDAYCGNSSGCQSASVTPNSDQDIIQTPAPTPVPVPTPAPAPLPAPAPAQQTLLYNFVAGDQQTCENSIRDRLGLNATCTIGGGCGVSCGYPSASCPSANPSLWGACMTK